MRLYFVAGVILGGVLSSCQEDKSFGDSYFVDELPGQRCKNIFRPRSAREAMKQAARLAQRERSAEKSQSYALLQDTAIGACKGIRVAVRDIVDVTTSKYSSPRFRGIRKSGAFMGRSVQSKEKVDDSGLAAKSRFRHSHQGTGSLLRRAMPVKRKPLRNIKKAKKMREKRNVVDDGMEGADFEMPRMSYDWNIKKKKKKKKKARTEVPTTKKVQKRSKKHRLYLESAELALRNLKDRPGKLVLDISQELDDLLKDADNHEEYTSPSLVIPTKVKFVPIPKNWQNPPSWKPPTRATSKGRWSRHHTHNIQTLTPQVELEVLATVREYEFTGEVTTLFDWKKYEHPLKVNEKHEKLVLKPAPSDWPEPTHPADGIYDWHKSQFRRAAGRTRRPFQSYTMLPRTAKTHQQFTDNQGMHQKSNQNSYHIFPYNTAWQSSTQRVRHGVSQYQSYQAYYTNYTNYYNQYYQNNFSQLNNKTAAFFKEENHVFHKQTAAKHYNSQFHQQSQLRPPAYFYGGHDEQKTTIGPVEEVAMFIPNEYAGNDRDLREPLATRRPFKTSQGYCPTRAWEAARYRMPAPLRRRFQPRQRRVPGGRPTGYRSIFTAPLQRAPWNNTLTQTIQLGNVIVTTRVL